ncbi:amidohydrolase family protein [Bauldia sp.]|uniref:amidohydrolase family protein n=1 Tax=Bauldia sp. TaxID=2575872 RepID=UPI003BA865C1
MRTLAFGALDDSLEVWLTQLGLEPPVDPYLRALVAFGRMAEGGIGIVNHCHNSQNFAVLRDETEAVARAANDLGVRVAFAVPLLGHNPIAYGDPAPLFAELGAKESGILRRRAETMPSLEEQLAVAEELFEFQDDLFTVQYGPVAPQWVDAATLENVAERSLRHGRRVHMHMLETKAQRESADASFPDGLVNRLDEIGLLSPRLTIAHGTYLTRDECDLLVDRGVAVSVNTSSNLRLRSGIAPVADYVASGLTFGMGLDGMAFDDDEDAFREMRLLWHLHRGFAYKEILSRDRLLKAVLFDGRKTILGPDQPDSLKEGGPADIALVDLDAVSGDTIPGRTDPLDLLLTRGTRALVQDLWIAGRRVLNNGVCTGVDLPSAEAELTDQARKAASTVDFESVDRIADAYRSYYRCGCHIPGAPARNKGAARG